MQFSNFNNIYCFRSNVRYIFKAIWVFFFSLFPAWSDEFELHNPYPKANTTVNSNNAINQQQENNTERNIENIENIDNNTDPNTGIYKNIINTVVIDEKIEEHKEKVLDNITHEYLRDRNSEKEKVVIKSYTDTRYVNRSEDQNNNGKYLLVEEENENKTENEFVFSENVNIDTLSYNEPLVESWKKKHEEETK